jgi:hypothetical protein
LTCLVCLRCLARPHLPAFPGLATHVLTACLACIPACHLCLNFLCLGSPSRTECVAWPSLASPACLCTFSGLASNILTAYLTFLVWHLFDCLPTYLPELPGMNSPSDFLAWPSVFSSAFRHRHSLVSPDCQSCLASPSFAFLHFYIAWLRTASPACLPCLAWFVSPPLPACLAWLGRASFLLSCTPGLAWHSPSLLSSCLTWLRLTSHT